MSVIDTLKAWWGSATPSGPHAPGPEMRAFKPLGSFVLVRRDDIEVSSGGIILDPKGIRRNFYVRCEVMAVGPGKWLKHPDTGDHFRRRVAVEPGQYVWFWLEGSVGSRVIELDGVQYGCVLEDWIDMVGDATVRVSDAKLCEEKRTE